MGGGGGRASRGLTGGCPPAGTDHSKASKGATFVHTQAPLMNATRAWGSDTENSPEREAWFDSHFSAPPPLLRGPASHGLPPRRFDVVHGNMRGGKGSPYSSPAFLSSGKMRRESQIWAFWPTVRFHRFVQGKTWETKAAGT